MKDVSVQLINEIMGEIDKSAGIGAGVGAGIGALGTAGIWAVQRLKLSKQMQLCQGDPACIARIKERIKSLRNKSLVGGALATAGGAAAGGYAGQYTGDVVRGYNAVRADNSKAPIFPMLNTYANSLGPEKSAEAGAKIGGIVSANSPTMKQDLAKEALLKHPVASGLALSTGVSELRKLGRRQ